MSRNRKLKRLGMILLITVAAVTAGFLCVMGWLTEPKKIQGGVLVHEQHVIYADR